MSVDTATVKKIASLARLAITDEDASRLAPELGERLDALGQDRETVAWRLGERGLVRHWLPLLIRPPVCDVGHTSGPPPRPWVRMGAAESQSTPRVEIVIDID